MGCFVVIFCLLTDQINWPLWNTRDFSWLAKNVSRTQRILVCGGQGWEIFWNGLCSCSASPPWVTWGLDTATKGNSFVLSKSYYSYFLKDIRHAFKMWGRQLPEFFRDLCHVPSRCSATACNFPPYRTHGGNPIVRLFEYGSRVRP